MTSPQQDTARHAFVAAEPTPAWNDIVSALQSDGVDCHWVSSPAVPADIPLQLPGGPSVVIVELAADSARGMAIVTACRQAHRQVPLIVVATSPPVDLVRRIRLAGVFYVALHPVGVEEMRGIVANAFDCLARHHQDASSTCRGPRSILIIDDDADYVASLTTLLESRGYTTSSAQSAREGLERLRARTPDLIVLDVVMEYESSGYEVNETVKYAPSFEGFRHVPILMVSSIPMDPPTRFQMAGEVDMITPNRYLTKPIDIPRFLAAVRELLGETDPVTA